MKSEMGETVRVRGLEMAKEGFIRKDMKDRQAGTCGDREGEMVGFKF